MKTRIIKFRAWDTRNKVNPKYEEFLKIIREEKRIDRNKGTVKQFKDEVGEEAFLGTENYMNYNVCVSNNGKVMDLEGGWDYKGDSKNAILMQFTGLKDKNDRDIYEKDIVEEYGKKRIIEYGYSEINPYGSTGDCAYGFNLERCCDNVEIIGNIYENPELLKK